MQTQPLPGFRDFYPADFAFRAHIFDTWRAVAARYGFEEWDGPPLEPLELYTAKSGEEIVGQLYSFRDKGDREVSLRPEMTPTLARVVAGRANALRKPIRWFSIPQLFRYERQQRGRLREHFQLNCDLIGEAGPLGDAEIIALAIDIIRVLGLGAKDVRVRLSDRRLLTSLLEQLGQEPPQVQAWFQVLDKLHRTPEPVSRDRLRAAGVGESAIDLVFGLSRRPSWQDLEKRTWEHPGVQAAVRSLLEVRGALGAMGIGEFADFDLTIVRGLAYYTGTVFELFDARGELRAICGGGRYDQLLLSLGGVDLPAVGFGMGDVVLGELLRERGLAPAVRPAIDVFVTGVTQEDVPHVLRTAHDLRDAGIRAEYALRSEALGKQLKLADVRNAAFALVIGPDDRARGEVQLKDLKGKTQRPIAAAEVVAEVKNLLAAVGRRPATVTG
jgi:histidyl-tRNA synthetase